MALAEIRIDQVRPAGTDTGTNGLSRNDLWNLQRVNLVHVGTGTAPTWTILQQPVGSAVPLNAPTSTLAWFVPTTIGTYRVQLTVIGATAVAVARVTRDSAGNPVLTFTQFEPAPHEEGEESNYAANVRGWDERRAALVAALDGVLVNVADAAALIAQPNEDGGVRHVLMDHLVTLGDGMGGPFAWRASSTTAHDGVNTLQPGYGGATPLATGRWERLPIGVYGPTGPTGPTGPAGLDGDSGWQELTPAVTVDDATDVLEPVYTIVPNTAVTHIQITARVRVTSLTGWSIDYWIKARAYISSGWGVEMIETTPEPGENDPYATFAVIAGVLYADFIGSGFYVLTWDGDVLVEPAVPAWQFGTAQVAQSWDMRVGAGTKVGFTWVSDGPVVSQTPLVGTGVTQTVTHELDSATSAYVFFALGGPEECAKLEYISGYSNGLTGSVPNFTDCTSLVEVNLSHNGLTAYSAATLPLSLVAFDVHDNLLAEADVDQILADFETNIASRPAVGIVLLNGTGNSTPSAAGLASRTAILTARPLWLVAINVAM
jgi:hypothetical protein